MALERRALLGGLAGGLCLILSPAAPASAPAPIVCTLPAGETSLPATAEHGLAHHLRQYPDLSLATASQRAAARRLLEAARAGSARWRSPRRATSSGFDLHLAKRAPGSTSVGYLHGESRRFANDRRFADPRRPEALIYANEPGRPLVLIGVMFSMPRGKRGPTPAGPIERWHSHVVCAVGRKRGRGQSPDGTCSGSARVAQGSEMLHVWFTHDLRSAFAVHAPVPELCRDGLLSPTTCRSGAGRTGM